MDPTTAEGISLWEKALVEGHASLLGVHIDLGDPGTDATGIELLVPGAVERVREVRTCAVPAPLDHLRPAAQRCIRLRGMRLLACDAADADRAHLPGRK